MSTNGAGVSEFLVDSTSSLVAALQSARGGDVIKLAPGVYDGLSLKGLSFDSAVTITSLNPSKAATITDFTISDSKGLRFLQLDFATLQHTDPAKASAWAFIVRDSSRITFEDSSFHGSLDNDVTNDIRGLQILNSDNIAVLDSEFQQLSRALAIGSTRYIKVVGNFAHDLRTDGFNFAEVGHVQVTGNTLLNFRPAEGDHPDAIQFWTSGTKTPSHDIQISGNVIARGDGLATQGIFLRDQLGTLPYERVTITDNLIVGTGYNAIRVASVNTLRVENNELISLPGGENKTTFLIQKSDNVVATGNKAISIGFDGVTNLTESGNSKNTAVDDLGLEAVRRWLDTRPDLAPQLSPVLKGLAWAGGHEVPGLTQPLPFDLVDHGPAGTDAIAIVVNHASLWGSDYLLA